MLERAMCALEGLSVGDAFGERFFGPPDEAVRRIEQRAVPAGRWRYTDDTEMALAIVEVLRARGRITPEAGAGDAGGDDPRDLLAHVFARRYAADPGRGYGGGAHDILRRIALGEPWRAVSASVFDGTGSMGNGGAMRAAPVGASFADDDARAASEARASAEVTHAHPEGQAGAIAVAVAAAWAWRTRAVREPDTDELYAAVLAQVPAGATRRGIERARALAGVDVFAAARELGNGSRVISEDTVPFCLWSAAHHLDGFEDAMWATVAALGDRDTTCAIVGGIVACRVGVDGIPAAWRAARESLALDSR